MATLPSVGKQRVKEWRPRLLISAAVHPTPPDISQAHFQTSYAPVTLPHCGWEVRIRNTFIEVEDDKEEGILRKCQSLPNFEALGQAA